MPRPNLRVRASRHYNNYSNCVQMGIHINHLWGIVPSIPIPSESDFQLESWSKAGFQVDGRCFGPGMSRVSQSLGGSTCFLLNHAKWYGQWHGRFLPETLTPNRLYSPSDSPSHVRFRMIQNAPWQKCKNHVRDS